LSKKHGQLRQATVKMVEKAMEFVNELQGAEKEKLITTLRDITEGKVRTHTLSLYFERNTQANSKKERLF